MSTGTNVNILVAATGPSLIKNAPLVAGTGQLPMVPGEAATFIVDTSNNYFVNPQGTLPGQDTATGTTWTLGTYDCYQTRHFSSASAVTVTVPTGLPPGCNANMIQDGAGQVQVAGGTGFTLHAYNANTHSAGQYAAFFVNINAGGTSGTLGGNIVP
jgi:hypothetical protein